MGISNYMSSTSQYNLQNSITSIHDFTITTERTQNKSQIYDRFAGNESFITDSILDSNFNTESITRYAHFTWDNVLVHNQSEISFDFLYYDADFLDSARFYQYFTIIDGRTPQNNQEYLIDAWTALKLNFSISFNISFPLTFRMVDKSELPGYSIPFENFSIVGIYVPNFEVYSVSTSEEYTCPIPFHPNYDRSSLNQTNYPIGPIFGYFDLKSPSGSHPINRYLLEVEQLVNNSYELFNYKYGIGINYRRASLNPVRVTQEYNKILDELMEFRVELSLTQDVHVYSKILRELYDFSNDFAITRLSFLALIIPIFLFAISLSNFIVLTNFNNRQEEFGRFQTKGYPKSMIIWQLLFESLFVGLFAFIMSIPISIGIFYLVQPLLNSVYIIVPLSFYFVPLKFVFSNYLMGFGIALVVSFLGNLITFIKIIKSKLSTLKARRQGLMLEVGYDENMFEESADYRKDGKLSPYLDQTKLMEKSIPKISFFFIAAAIIPFIAIFFRYLGYLPNASDQMRLIAQGITGLMKIILVFASLSPVLLVYGLLRFFIQESPSKYAKISKFFAKPFLKDQDYLVGLEMLRRKPYILVIFLLGLFTTSLVFGNINRHTQVREIKFFDNLNAVSDINITFNGTTQYNTYQNISLTDLEAYSQSLFNLEDENNQPIVQNLAHISFFPADATGNEYKFWNPEKSLLCATNLSAYSAVIHPEIKNAFPSIESSLQKLQEFRAQSTNDTIGIVVNSYFLDETSTEIGDTYDFDYETNTLNDTSSTFTIVDVIDYIPAVSEYTFEPIDTLSWGAFGASSQVRLEFQIALCDFSDIPLNESYYITESFTTLIQSNSVLNSSEISLSETLSPVVDDFNQKIRTSNNKPMVIYTYYDPFWSQAQLNDFEYDSLISINLLYLDLIIIGVLIAFAVATTIIGLEKKNLHFDGLLLSRGFGRKKIMLMITAQIVVIFLFSVLLGGLGALLTGWTWMSAYLGTRTHYSWYGSQISQVFHFPIQISAPELLLILGLDFCLTVVLYLIYFIIQERKSISGFLIKF
jgi:ABC-type antimicrobial peptide transport system permease subunit